MSGGLRFFDMKDILATVVENGVDPDAAIVMTRTNEAIKAILDERIPVGGMLTIDINGSGMNGDELFLPKELENAIEAQALGTVFGDSDQTNSWYDIVNQFAYVDPAASHDNALVDLFLQPDPADPTILRRKYQFPGLAPNSTVRVTGAKRYIPITSWYDYPIVQNVLAIKDMIQSIERKENNDIQGSELYHKACIDRIDAEVKKHMLDPRNMMRRKGDYYKDIANFAPDTFGWMRANMALEVPGLLNKGKMDITFSLNQAEKRLMQRGLWKDTIQEYTSEVVNGLVAFPIQVQSVLAADMNGHPLNIRSVFYEYLQNGSGKFASHPVLIDQGDEDFQGGRRRVYKLKGWTRRVPPSVQTTPTERVTAVCKLRWLEKKPNDQMVIKNFEALRLMLTAINFEEAEKWDEAQAAIADAFATLEAEQREYLSGILHTVHVQSAGFGMQSTGAML